MSDVTPTPVVKKEEKKVKHEHPLFTAAAGGYALRKPHQPAVLSKTDADFKWACMQRAITSKKLYADKRVMEIPDSKSTVLDDIHTRVKERKLTDVFDGFTHIYLRFQFFPNRSLNVQCTRIKLTVENMHWIWPYIRTKTAIGVDWKNDAWFQMIVFLDLCSTNYPHWPKGQSKKITNTDTDPPVATDFVWSFGGMF